MRRANYILVVVVVFGLLGATGQAARTITVGPGGGYDFNDIQAAVDDANTGDTVLVAPAEYVITESIWIEGKAVTLRSQAGPEVTTIRISPTDPDRRNVVTLWQHGTDGSVVEGFTMADGEGWYNPAYDEYGGGAILCYICEVTIANCRITGSSAYTGAGILLYDGDASTITNCTMWDNTSSHDGGGMTFNESDDVTVSNCTVFGNSAGWGAGGVCVWYPSATITNCTLFGNSAADYGGAVGIGFSSATITNSILWGNSADTGSQVDLAGDLNVSYSDVEDGEDEVHQWQPGTTLNWGPGNIDTDPFFADADGNDNVVGTEDDNLRLSPNSPCIDAGENAAVPVEVWTDLDGHPRIIDGDCNDTHIVDMGAYEFNYAYMGDFDYDCDVEFGDYAILGLAWLTESPDENWNRFCDIGAPDDDYIYWSDLKVVADNWLADFE
jgi:hypothetical protein